jgi:hypothetical protein
MDNEELIIREVDSLADAIEQGSEELSVDVEVLFERVRQELRARSELSGLEFKPPAEV